MFARQMMGTDYPTRYELLQEFVHAAGIYWLDEHHAYCKVDENGDIEPIVSITDDLGEERFVLITCKRKPLEQYLAATGNVLARLFDFMMIGDGFSSLHDGVQRGFRLERSGQCSVRGKSLSRRRSNPCR